MTFSEKITQLVDMIHSTLPQFIGRKCVLLDVPYYENIGDVLIWEGTECFLRQNKIKCIYRASKDTYEASKVPRGVTILLQGGGNFGDLWRQHQEFRLKVIQNHPDNKIMQGLIRSLGFNYCGDVVIESRRLAYEKILE